MRANSTKQAARAAGLLYLLVSIPGFFGLIYVPSALLVPGDPIATAHNIAASETLFRGGVVANLIGQAGFLFVALTLYRLLKGVDRGLASLMVTLIALSIPISFVNELDHLAVLPLLQDVGAAGSLGEAQRNALVALSLRRYADGIDVVEIFWGLWLFPLGVLVIRSRFLPRILGVFLIAAGAAWLAESLTSLLAPAFGHVVGRFTSPLRALELATPLWLLIMGARDRPPAS